MCRYWNGDWDACWGGLAGSVGDGKVDRVCGEATVKNLKGKLESSIAAVYDQQIRDLNERLKTLQVERGNSIDYINKMFEGKR